MSHRRPAWREVAVAVVGESRWFGCDSRRGQAARVASVETQPAERVGDALDELPARAEIDAQDAWREPRARHGLLLVQEAGGRVLPYPGPAGLRAGGAVIASAPPLYDELSTMAGW